MDKVIHYISVGSLEEINNLLQAVANVGAREVGIKQHREKEKEAMVEEAYPGTDRQSRKEVSQFHYLKEGRLQNVTIKESMERKYKIRKRGLGIITEELKPRISAKAKIRHVERRVNQY